MAPLSLTIIGYDIRCDRRRRRVARIADDFGCRVQYSVFYGWLSVQQRDELVKTLVNVIDPAEDSIVIVPACKRCREQVVELGQASIEPLPQFWFF